MSRLLQLPPLAVLPEHPSLGESVIFQLNGLIVVFTALCSIWLMLELSGAFFRRRAARSAKAVTPVAATVPAPAATSPSDPDRPLPPELVAVITAAVHVTLGRAGARISSIAPANAPADWAREGRREIFSSHRVR